MIVLCCGGVLAKAHTTWWKCKLLSHVQLFAAPWTIQSMEFSRPEYWRGSLSLLQEIFQTRGSNPVQFSHSVMSNSLRPHELQHPRPPCPSPTPGAHPNSCPLSQWCHPTISSITSHIHNWVLFLLWLHPFILSGVISPLISSSILGTYQPREFPFQYPTILPFHTVHGVLKARILKWLPFPSPVDHILSPFLLFPHLFAMKW